jgi:23S rRNA pseudouridine2605 synthase
MQLNKFVARSGVCSRRKAAELVTAGHINVDGKVVKNPAYRVLPENKVLYGRRTLKAVKKYAYFLLNKPVGLITTCEDTHERATVMDLIPRQISRRLFPVGRLDIDSRGALLLTDDGDLANLLTSPRFQMKKCYRVTIHAPLREEFAEQLRTGIRLEDGIIACDDIEVKSPCGTVVDVVLHSGKYRVIRRMFAKGGYHVKDLCRISFAGMSVRGLAAGQWRLLTAQEIAFLYRKTKKNGKIDCCN